MALTTFFNLYYLLSVVFLQKLRFSQKTKDRMNETKTNLINKIDFGIYIDSHAYYCAHSSIHTWEEKAKSHCYTQPVFFLYTKNIQCLENKGNINSFLKKDNDQHPLKQKFA